MADRMPVIQNGPKPGPQVPQQADGDGKVAGEPVGRCFKMNQRGSFRKGGFGIVPHLLEEVPSDQENGVGVTYAATNAAMIKGQAIPAVVMRGGKIESGSIQRKTWWNFI